MSDNTTGTRNRVICPECGKVRVETPPGTTVLPTLGMARKAAGTAGRCEECGRTPEQRLADRTDG